jgi:hypothetical protein
LDTRPLASKKEDQNRLPSTWLFGDMVNLRFRDFGLAFLLACFSWLILTPIWIHASPGGLVDTIIGGMFHIPYRVGKHLAHVLFPDSATRNTTRYYLAPIIGVAGEIVLLTALWLTAICVVYWRQSPKHKPS